MSRPAPAFAQIAPVRIDADAKLAALRRTKFLATAALALCVLVFAAAKSFEGRFAWLGFVAAFVAETVLNVAGG